jgi:hypothetical protein
MPDSQILAYQYSQKKEEELMKKYERVSLDISLYHPPCWGLTFAKRAKRHLGKNVIGSVLDYSFASTMGLTFA